MGKAANATISYLHNFLPMVPEINVVMHADKCSGQNNNNRVAFSYLIHA